MKLSLGTVKKKLVNFTQDKCLSAKNTIAGVGARGIKGLKMKNDHWVVVFR